MSEDLPGRRADLNHARSYRIQFSGSHRRLTGTQAGRQQEEVRCASDDHTAEPQAQTTRAVLWGNTFQEKIIGFFHSSHFVPVRDRGRLLGALPTALFGGHPILDLMGHRTQANYRSFHASKKKTTISNDSEGAVTSRIRSTAWEKSASFVYSSTWGCPRGRFRSPNSRLNLTQNAVEFQTIFVSIRRTNSDPHIRPVTCAHLSESILFLFINLDGCNLRII